MKFKSGLIIIYALMFSSYESLFANGSNESPPVTGNLPGNNFEYVVGTTLIQTKWGQGTPYNSMTPADNNGAHSHTGCWPVAVSQIMKYHEWPSRGSGQSETYTASNLGKEIPSVSFNINYDWNNMLNTYTANATVQEKNAVATLMFHIGVSLRSNFGTGSTGVSNETLVQTALPTFFRYDKSSRYLFSDYYDYNTWEMMLKEQIDAGQPAVYCPNQKSHAYIVDGYNTEGKFHFNCGWNGANDGWYTLEEIREGEFNDKMLINIKPDKGGSSISEIVLDRFNPSKTSVRQNELFTINIITRNLGNIVNPVGQIGAALTDSSGNIIKIMGAVNYNALNPMSTRETNITCYVPETVSAGSYQLRIVIRPTISDGVYGDWRIATMSASADLPASINFTVR